MTPSGLVSVAIVDSGVHVPHPHLPAVAGGVAIDLQGMEHDDYTDLLGHGTAIASAIHEKAPSAEIYAVKIFDDALATSGAQYWMAKTIPVHVAAATAHEKTMVPIVGKQHFKANLSADYS